MGDFPELTPDRPHELVSRLTATLSIAGAASARIDDLSVSIDPWLRAAQTAGRSLDRPVATTITGGSVHAVLRDWPATEAEAARDRAEMQR